MKKFLSVCLFLLIALMPGYSHAGQGHTEKQDIERLTLEVAQATS